MRDEDMQCCPHLQQQQLLRAAGGAGARPGHVHVSARWQRSRARRRPVHARGHHSVTLFIVEPFYS